MVKNKDRWSALSMTERADLINTYIQNGVLKLNEMKEHYNSFGNGGDTWEKVDKFVEKAEPWVSGTSLAATGTALAVSAASGGTAAPVALPVAATIGTISNGAGVLIDGYQSARALMEGDYKKALGNGIEAVLGSFGGKYAAKLAKTTGGRAIGKFKEELVRERFANSGEKITRLMRKGLTYEKAAEQVFKNAVNYVDNSSKVKDVITSIQDARNKKFEKAAQIADTVFDVKDTGVGIYNSFKEEHPVEIYKCGGKLNSFGDGGDTTNASVQADKIREQAYQTSLDTKEVRVPIIKLTDKEISSLQEELFKNTSNIKNYIRLKNMPSWVVKTPKETADYAFYTNNDWYNKTISRNKEIEELLRKGCKIGSSCTFHSTGHYGPKYQMASSQDFADTSGNNAFVEVANKDALPGDIVLSYKKQKDGNWAPHHTLMFSKWDSYGNPRYNASNGKNTSDALRWDQLYNITDSTRTYRFVGTPEDRAYWNANGFGNGGRILDGETEENQTLSNEPWYKRLGKAIVEGGQSARDARIGAVGAQQVRDLYSEGKDAEAQALAQQYAKANTTGIALASGTLSSNLISDLILGEALTAVDTFIDGDISNLGYNLASNISGEILGHGIGKLLSRVYPKISKEATAKIEALLKRFPEGVESVSSVSKELRDRLIKEGVDPAILTKTNLRKMVYLRGKDLLESDAPAKFAGRTNSKITNTYNLYHNTDGQIKQVGYVATTPEDGVGKINMIENITEHTPDKVKGVSELGYNTVIKDIGASKNGTVLMQPHKTMRVIDKYPDKVVIANDGEWFNGSKYIGGNPIFQLNSPTYDVPIKYLDDFSIESIDDNGNFIIDFNKGPLYLHGGKLNLNALGGHLYNKHNPIESFSGSSKIPVVRKRTNSLSDGGPTNEGGWPEATLNKRKKKYNRYDPTGGLGIDQLAYWFFGGNQSKGDENEYWKAYLGLDNNVPKMRSTSKTEWDDQIEAEKIAKGELPSDFYGTTDNMDLYIQAMADTTTTGQIVRNYDEFKTLNPTLASKEEIEAMYKSGKAMMDNPNKWTQVGEKKREAQLDIEDKLVNNEQYPLGMLAAFGAKWLPEENTIHIHDTYDFPKLNSFLGRIPERPKEMKIRGKVKYNPKNRAKLFNSDNFNLKFPK